MSIKETRFFMKSWAAVGMLRAAAVVGVLSFLLTFFVPLAFYCLFNLFPFSGDTMWRVVEVLWEPLKFLVDGLSRLFSCDLWQYINPLYAAPFVNAVIGALFAFGVWYCHTLLRRKEAFRDT
jgi:hypothetical protein